MRNYKTLCALVTTLAIATASGCAGTTQTGAYIFYDGKRNYTGVETESSKETSYGIVKYGVGIDVSNDTITTQKDTETYLIPTGIKDIDADIDADVSTMFDKEGNIDVEVNKLDADIDIEFDNSILLYDRKSKKDIGHLLAYLGYVVLASSLFGLDEKYAKLEAALDAGFMATLSMTTEEHQVDIDGTIKQINIPGFDGDVRMFMALETTIVLFGLVYFSNKIILDDEGNAGNIFGGGTNW